VEHFALEKDIYNFELLLHPASRLTPRDGTLTPHDVPGVGIQLDEDSVARFAVAG
jgi:L-alanine-DL-glutamate epimerase-like enolase superfamily enzyme